MDNKARHRDVERFNRWAAAYDKSVFQRLFFAPIHSAMLDLVVQGGIKDSPGCIIDVGCGTGRLLKAASERWPDAKLFGIDPAEQMVSEARRLNPSIHFEVASAESLPFPDQSADIIVSNVSFHHWADQRKGIQEIARVLCVGGLFCLADQTLLIARLVGEKVRSRREIRALMNDAGFTVRSHQRMRMRFVLITLAQK